MAVSLGISLEEFKHLNPRKLNYCVRGYEMKQKREDKSIWQQWAGYGIPATAIAVRNGAWGKNKLEYPKEPLTIANDPQTKEDKIKKQRELVVASLMAMQANFEMTHPKGDKK